MNEGEKHAEGVKSSVDDIIGVDTTLKLKKKTEDDIQREKFEQVIRLVQEIETRGVLMAEELQVDFSTYDEKFYNAIDIMFELHFGKEAAEIIFFYLYERTNPDGSTNDILDANDYPIPLDTVADLWSVVKLAQARQKLGRQKKK
jgi:hypothetical protein